GLFQGGGQKPADPAKTLKDNGPQLPLSYSLGQFVIQGFAEGNWPVVLDVRIDQPGHAWLEIVASGAEPYVYRLDGTKAGQRQYVRFDWPARFGQKRPVLFALRTMQNVIGEAQTLPFHVYGIGCGPKAVGSVAVDQVHFGPPSYSLKRDKTHKDD